VFLFTLIKFPKGRFAFKVDFVGQRRKLKLFETVILILRGINGIYCHAPRLNKRK
jgi:hypothetical protein